MGWLNADKLNADGTLKAIYPYDVFGNLTDSTGDTENSCLYCGEQFDTTTACTTSAPAT